MRRIPLNARVGTANGAAKLDEDAVRWILSRRYLPSRELAAAVGITEMQAKRIKMRWSWAHVELPPVVCPTCGKPHVCGTKPRKDWLCTECWESSPEGKEYRAHHVLKYRRDVGEISRFRKHNPVRKAKRVEIARNAAKARWANRDAPLPTAALASSHENARLPCPA